jgi:hypothetical protein
MQQHLATVFRGCRRTFIWITLAVMRAAVDFIDHFVFRCACVLKLVLLDKTICKKPTNHPAAAHQLHTNCPPTAQQLHTNCPPTPQQQHTNCTPTAHQPPSNCTPTAHQLHTNCPATALTVRAMHGAYACQRIHLPSLGYAAAYSLKEAC